ncbi:hypothetical protein Tco_0339522 [Tanacetum coccineum]
MVPTTPPPVLAVPPPSVYEVGGPSTAVAEGLSFPQVAPRLPVPPCMIEDLSSRLDNLECGHGQLVQRVVQGSDAEIEDGVIIGEISPRVLVVEGQMQVIASQMIQTMDKVEQVGVQVELVQQTSTQIDETVTGLTQQVQALQADVQQRDTQIQQLQTIVTEISSKECTLMRCILGLKKWIAALKRIPPGPFLRWVEAEMVSPEVESEKWRRPLLHWMYDALNVSTDGREEDCFPRNGVDEHEDQARHSGGAQSPVMVVRASLTMKRKKKVNGAESSQCAGLVLGVGRRGAVVFDDMPLRKRHGLEEDFGIDFVGHVIVLGSARDYLSFSVKEVRGPVRKEKNSLLFVFICASDLSGGHICKGGLFEIGWMTGDNALKAH